MKINTRVKPKTWREDLSLRLRLSRQMLKLSVVVLFKPSVIEWGTLTEEEAK